MLASLFLSSTPSSLTLKPRSSASSFHGVRIPSPTSVSFHKLPTSSSSSSSSVVMMAKKDEELKDIRTKSNEELNDEILQLKGELFMLRLQKSAKEEFKPSEFTRIKKRIARMMTVKREREMEQGIGKRLSRKLDREWKRTIVIKPPPAFKKLQEEKAKEAEKASSA